MSLCMDLTALCVTLSDGNINEEKTYHGIFGFEPNVSYGSHYELHISGKDEVTDEMRNILFQCTHHPLSGEQFIRFEGFTGFRGQ